MWDRDQQYFSWNQGSNFLRVQGSKFTSSLRSGIKILSQSMGSVTKIIPRYNPDIMCRSTETSTSLPTPPPPPPLGKAWAFELLDRSNSRPLGPKWCSNARPYCQTCLSYPTKEQSSLALSVFIKDLLKAFFVSQSLTNATSLPLKSSISSKHMFYGC